jgi:hypothetical protein
VQDIDTDTGAYYSIRAERSPMSTNPALERREQNFACIPPSQNDGDAQFDLIFDRAQDFVMREPD